MSYVRVNDSSDSEDDVANSSVTNAPSAPTTPSAHIRRVGSAAAASLASLTRTNGSNAHEYSPVGGHVEEEDAQEDSARNRGNTGHDRSEAQTQSESENDIEIHVRFGEGQDLSLRVPRTDTVAQLKEKVWRFVHASLLIQNPILSKQPVMYQ
ncbi:hypothetical protein EDD21DRAFT_242290 [Dissophora ornata]|nr:hypothetical protein EDD21DRAFT_242290 [Dissophora ornata]